jgi:hypothetical protein
MSAIADAEKVMFREGLFVGLDGLDGHRGIAKIFDDEIGFGPVQISRDRDAAAVFKETMALGAVEIDDQNGDVVRSRDRKGFSNDVDATRHVYLFGRTKFFEMVASNRASVGSAVPQFRRSRHVEDATGFWVEGVHPLGARFEDPRLESRPTLEDVVGRRRRRRRRRRIFVGKIREIDRHGPRLERGERLAPIGDLGEIRVFHGILHELLSAPSRQHVL